MYRHIPPEALVPVTAKLSKAFYDRFGENIVTELVDLLNLVDSTYRAELRESNERNFERFDARLDQRMTALDAKLDQRITAIQSKLELRIATLESKLDQRFVALEARLDQKTIELNARIDAILPGVNEAIARESRRTMAWFLATLIALIGPMMILASRR